MIRTIMVSERWRRRDSISGYTSDSRYILHIAIQHFTDLSRVWLLVHRFIGPFRNWSDLQVRRMRIRNHLEKIVKVNELLSGLNPYKFYN